MPTLLLALLLSAATPGPTPAMQPLLDEDHVVHAALPAARAGEQTAINGAPRGAPGGKRPNIVVIVTDDQPPGHLSVSGNRVLRTPAIDGLAARGVFFEQLYLTIGQCAPSRASLWTSRLPHNHSVVTNGLILPAGELTMPEILQANGYDTAIIGKCHLGDPQDPEKYKRGFDHRVLSFPDVGMLNDWYSYELMRDGVRGGTETKYVTDKLTDEAVQFLQGTSRSQPFFLWLAYFAPHLPTTPPAGANRYQLSQMLAPISAADDLSTKPPQQLYSPSHASFVEMGGWNAMRAKLKDAYEVMSNVDDNVARLLAAIDALGIRDDTVIVFLSDNGLQYGEHQLYQKGPFFYEEQIRSPLIISYPPVTSAPRHTRALASSLDLAPTLLELAGIPAPATAQGRSLVPVLKGADEHRNSVYLEYAEQAGRPYPMRGVVADGFKWVHYIGSTYTLPDGTVLNHDGMDHELYDLAEDPHEMRNLMAREGPADNPLMRMLADPSFGPRVQKLRKIGALWQTDTTDPVRRTLSDLNLKVLSPGEIEVSWTSDAKATSEVEVATVGCASCAVLAVDDFALATSHTVRVGGLKGATRYELTAYSIGANGNGGYLRKVFSTTPVPDDPPDAGSGAAAGAGESGGCGCTSPGSAAVAFAALVFAGLSAGRARRRQAR